MHEKSRISTAFSAKDDVGYAHGAASPERDDGSSHAHAAQSRGNRDGLGGIDKPSGGNCI